MIKPSISGKIGAVFYILWGLLFMFAGTNLVSVANLPTDYFSRTAPNIVIAADKFVSNPALVSLAAFHAFNYIWIGLAVVVIGVIQNWRNKTYGFLVNLLLTTSITFGFVYFNLISDNMPIESGLPVALLWLFANVFCGLGITMNRSKDEVL